MLVETVAFREYRGRKNWWDVNLHYSRRRKSTEQANVYGSVKNSRVRIDALTKAKYTVQL